jgi:hypothetical protein
VRGAGAKQALLPRPPLPSFGLGVVTALALFVVAALLVAVLV